MFGQQQGGIHLDHGFKFSVIRILKTTQNIKKLSGQNLTAKLLQIIGKQLL